MKKKILTLLVLLMTAATGAWAETETITTASELWQGAKTFTGTNVTVSVQNGGNENGSYVSVTNTMDISVTGDNIITGLVLTIGINSGQAGYMLAQPGQCTVSGSGSHSTFVTVTDINASSVTMVMDDYAVYVEKVEVTYANPYTPTPVANTTNQWKFLMPAGDVELEVEYYPGMLSLGGDAIEGGKLEIVELVGTTSFTAPSEWNHNTTKLASSHFEGFKGVTEEEAKAWSGVPATGKVALFYNYDETEQKWDMIYFTDGAISQNFKGETQQLATIYNFSGYNFSVFYTTGMQMPAGFEKDEEGNIYVEPGTEFQVKVVPEEGYHFVCWSDDETNTNPEREITMPADGSDLSLTATFAENEYDITFSEGTNPDPENPEWTATPNPAKTKQTVTVTYTGSKKVIGVKAEKKSSAPTLKDALADGATVVITYTWFDTNVTTFTYTNNGGTYTGNTTGVEAEYFANGMSKDGTTLKFTVSNVDIPEANVSIDFDTDTNEYYFNGKGSGFTSFTISVNGTDFTSQLKEVK